MTNVIPAPAILRPQIKSVFVRNPHEVPFIGVIVPVISQCVIRQELKSLRGLVPDRQCRGIVVGTRGALLLTKNAEIRVGS